jgi:hypothetical protein
MEKAVLAGSLPKFGGKRAWRKSLAGAHDFFSIITGPHLESYSGFFWRLEYCVTCSTNTTTSDRYLSKGVQNASQARSASVGRSGIVTRWSQAEGRASSDEL